jgi:hypothetical protein
VREKTPLKPSFFVNDLAVVVAAAAATGRGNRSSFRVREPVT